MEEILEAAKKRCEQAEVYRVWRRDTPAQFEANRLKLLQTRETSGTALRIVKDGRIGFSATNDPGEVQGLVDRAIELSQFGAEARFQLPGPMDYPSVRLYDEATEQFSVEHMVQLGQTMIDAIREGNPDLLGEARVTKTIAEQEVLNTNGGHARYKKSVFFLSVDGTLIRGTDMLFVGEYQSSASPILETRALTDVVRQQLEMARETVSAPMGKAPVLFTPHGVASALLSPLLAGFNGRTVYQGASPLVGKLGQKLFDARISVWDDPTIDLASGSHIADDEGLPARRTPLIEDGVAVNFLYDLQTAGLAGTQSTASAARSLGSLPRPSMSLVTVKGGQDSFGSMLSGIKEGLLVEQLLGAGQGNVLGGEFSGNVLLGYRIENGKVAGRVKDTMISGNVYEALNSIVAMSSEPRWVGGGVLTPAICCDGVTVSRSG